MDSPKRTGSSSGSKTGGRRAARSRRAAPGRSRGPSPRSPGELDLLRELEAERAHRDQLLSVLAHDLRGPMTVIRGYSSLLRRVGLVDEVRRERALKAIEDASLRLELMLNELLEVTRIAEGRFSVSPASMDLMALVRQVVDAHRQNAPGHQFVLQGPERLDGCWDQDRLAQLLNTLLARAVKQSPLASEVRLRVEPRPGEAHLSVADQGRALSADERTSLFEPFQRLAQSRSLQAAGLELFVCKGVAESHGGEIWVESGDGGQGSTFRVRLPLAPPSGQVAKAST